MRILFITATRVGDAVLSTGLLDHLIRESPDARVTVACGPMAAPLFEAVPNLERIIVLEKQAFSLHWVRLWAACVGRYWDVLIDLRNSPMPYLLAAGARRRGGGRQPVHRVRQLAAVVGLEADPPAPRLWVAEKHQDKARALIADGPPVLAVGPTANWEAKMWGAGNFTQLVGRLCAADGILPGARVAVFGHAAERPAASGLIDAIPPERCIDLVGQGDLLAVFACLRRCAFYVGNDSGLMHMAAASGVPTLGLFGPSDAGRYAPWGPLTAVARTAVPYEELVGAPDFDHRATASLMDSLSVDAAEAAARALWRRCQGEAKEQLGMRP